MKDLDDGRDESTIEAELNKEFVMKFGGRCQSFNTGGAPISPAVLAWMNSCFGSGADAVASQNYGCTEVGNIALNGYVESK